MLTGKGSRQTKKNCVKPTAYPCGFSCIAKYLPNGKEKVCRNKLNGKPYTFTLWLKQMERLAKVNQKRTEKGRSTIYLNEESRLTTAQSSLNPSGLSDQELIKSFLREKKNKKSSVLLAALGKEIDRRRKNTEHLRQSHPPSVTTTEKVIVEKKTEKEQKRNVTTIEPKIETPERVLYAREMKTGNPRRGKTAEQALERLAVTRLQRAKRVTSASKPSKHKTDRPVSTVPSRTASPPSKKVVAAPKERIRGAKKELSTGMATPKDILDIREMKTLAQSLARQSSSRKEKELLRDAAGIWDTIAYGGAMPINRVESQEEIANSNRYRNIVVVRSRDGVESAAKISHRGSYIYVEYLVTNPRNIVGGDGSMRGAGTAALIAVAKKAYEEGKGFHLTSLSSAVSFYRKIGMTEIEPDTPFDPSHFKVDKENVLKFIERNQVTEHG